MEPVGCPRCGATFAAGRFCSSCGTLLLGEREKRTPPHQRRASTTSWGWPEDETQRPKPVMRSARQRATSSGREESGPARSPAGRDGPKLDAAQWVAVGIALLVVIALVSLLDGGSTESTSTESGSNDAGLEELQDVGVDVERPFGWAYDTTCAQYQEVGPEGKRALAVELSEEVNTPLGNRAAVAALMEALVDVCAEAAPEFQPGNEAGSGANDATGGTTG